MTVPQGNPILHFDVANVRGGDFRLEVKVDGICLLATEIADSFGISGADRILRPFDISLSPWRGQTVKIELVNRPTGWNGESAIWHDVRVDSLKQ